MGKRSRKGTFLTLFSIGGGRKKIILNNRRTREGGYLKKETMTSCHK